eukprot:jgi/Tetstr1/462745/TSEL_000705.t1
MRKLLATECVTDGIAPAFGQRLEAIIHIMEAVGRRLASRRETPARQCFGGGHHLRHERDRDESGSNSDNLKTARPVREATASCIIFGKDTAKDSSKVKAKAKTSTTDKAE